MREEAERRRGFGNGGQIPEERARNSSLFCDDLLYARLGSLIPLQRSSGGFGRAVWQSSGRIQGNREFLSSLRNAGKYFYPEENRELDLKLIDYDDPQKNVYEVTEEFYWHNGHYGNREDIVFLINGIPVLVFECKNASK